MIIDSRKHGWNNPEGVSWLSDAHHTIPSGFIGRHT